MDDLIDERLWAFLAEAREFDRETGIRATMSAPGPRSPEEMVAMREALPDRPAGEGPPAVEEVVEAEGRRVPLRIFGPQGTAPRGVYLDIHGGGFFMGRARRGDARNRRLADALGIAVVSVEYRLAPEDPWPAGPDDCETAALWMAENAEERFGASPLAIGGASSGGNLAMTTLLRLRDRGLVERFVGVVLLYGAFDLSGRSPGGRRMDEEFLVEGYAGHAEDLTNPDISPLFADLHDLPPALLLCGTDDILFEDNLAMAGRLAAAGNEVDLRAYPEAPHGFSSFPIAMGRAAWEDIEAWLGDRLAGTESG